MKMMFVRPVRRVLDPQTKQPLAAEGERVPRNSYWLRRLFEGSVMLDEHLAPVETVEAVEAVEKESE